MERKQNENYRLWTLVGAVFALIAAIAPWQMDRPMTLIEQMFMIGGALVAGYSLGAWKYAPMMTRDERIAANWEFERKTLFWAGIAGGSVALFFLCPPIALIAVPISIFLALIGINTTLIIPMAAIISITSIMLLVYVVAFVIPKRKRQQVSV